MSKIKFGTVLAQKIGLLLKFFLSYDILFLAGENFMILVPETLKVIEDLFELAIAIEVEKTEHQAELEKCMKEKSKIAKQLRRVTETEVNGLKALSNVKEARIKELTDANETLDVRLDNIRTQICEKCGFLFETLGAHVYHMEVRRICERKLGGKWNMQWIKSWNGNNVGIAFVNEKDPNFNKEIHADISLANETVDIENTDTLKVMFTDVCSEPQAIYLSWNWLELYVYAKTGFYFDDYMINHFDTFLERDEDFAEFICRAVRDEVERTELGDFIETKEME